MRAPFLFLLLCFATINVWAQVSEKSDTGQALGLTLFNSKDLFLDYKFIDPQKGSFGMDYKLDMTRDLGALGGSAVGGKEIKFNLKSVGFMTVVGDKNQNNSIISEMQLQAFPLFKMKSKGATKDVATLMSEGKTLEEISQIMAEEMSSPLWLFLNIHGKHESTQNFKNYDLALGTQFSLTTSYLNSVLDFPFSLLRIDPNNNPRQLDLSIGYDYVTGATPYITSTDRNNSGVINRLNFKGEWETGILSERDRIAFLFDSYCNLNATDLMKSKKEQYNYFYMIRVDHLLKYDESTKTSTKISIKYTKGALPPLFLPGSVMGGGFAIDF